MSKLFAFLCTIAFMFSANTAAAKGHYHCEKVTKSGKHKVLEKVKSKRKCKKLGGEWVKHDEEGDHDHEHEGGEHSHSH